MSVYKVPFVLSRGFFVSRSNLNLENVSTPFVLNPVDRPFNVFAWINSGVPGRVIISRRESFGVNGLPTGQGHASPIVWDNEVSVESVPARLTTAKSITIVTVKRGTA
ncbi:MAG: hypothetical protein ACYTEK_00445 [Planctomycetota bacterium]|jgi:hypothetical protein